MELSTTAGDGAEDLEFGKGEGGPMEGAGDAGPREGTIAAGPISSCICLIVSSSLRLLIGRR